MMVVLTYDIDTTGTGGEVRLQRVARICERYGRRVQHSVFEMNLDPKKLDDLKAELDKMIIPEKDSIRFYRLGKNFEDRISVMGNAEPTIDTSMIMV